MAGMAELGFVKSSPNQLLVKPPADATRNQRPPPPYDAQRYPAGRDKLMSLAEAPSAGKTKLSAAKHPRMGLKGKPIGTDSNMAYVEEKPPGRPSPIYNSEQSLPDRLSQVLKGLSTSFIRAQNQINNSNLSGGSVAADDVIYYSSSNGSSGERKTGASSSSPHPNQPIRIEQRKTCIGHYANFSQSIGVLNADQLGSKNAYVELEPGATIDSGKNQQYMGFGESTLDQLRELYRSMPDCSTLGRQQKQAERARDRSADGRNSSALDNYNNNRQSIDWTVNSAYDWDHELINNQRPTSTEAELRVERPRQPTTKDVEENAYANIEDYRLANQPSHQLETNQENTSILIAPDSPPEYAIPPLCEHARSPTDSGYRSVPGHLDCTGEIHKPMRVYFSPEGNGFQKRVTVVENGNYDRDPQFLVKPIVKPVHQDNKISIEVAKNENNNQPTNGQRSAEPKLLTVPISGEDLTYGSGELSSPSCRSTLDDKPCGPDKVVCVKNKPKRNPALKDSFETVTTNRSGPEGMSLDTCPKLVELDRVPWNERDVISVLQKGRTKDTVDRVAVQIVPRLTYLLQRPLIRLARELQRLSQRFGKCSRNDVQTAAKIVLSGSLAESCLKAGLQATALYAMSGDCFKQSKSRRSGLRFSVGKFHRWLCDSQVSFCIVDQASVFTTAVLECVLEEIILRCVPASVAKASAASSMLTSEILDASLGTDPELWGLLQPQQHLVCSRTADGALHLPEGLLERCQHERKKAYETSDYQGQNCHGGLFRNFEQALLATCVGSAKELGDLITKVSEQLDKIGADNFLSVSGLGGRNGQMQWSKEAIDTLFYFMRCSQLEHADKPVAVALTHERPYVVLPPLFDYLRVSQSFCEHRQGSLVDDDDVRQAARILLPGLDCPPTLFDGESTSHFVRGSSKNWSPQSSGKKLKERLGMDMLATGKADIMPAALPLIGPQKLNSFNEHGLTPLMRSVFCGDRHGAKMLLDGGADLNMVVPSVIPNPNKSLQYPRLLQDLSGWSALTFAVARKDVKMTEFLLGKGAETESTKMTTESPLQLAAMIGNQELLAQLLRCGADPYYSTIQLSSESYGFKQRGSPCPLALAAGHGRRMGLHLMLRKGQKPCGSTDEPMSLQDFLAEGSKHGPLKVHGPINHGSHQHQELGKKEQKVLQEAMYQAAESGHVEIVMDLRNFGIPWTIRTWTETLTAAHELRRKQTVDLLLADFLARFGTSLDLELGEDFSEEGLPVLFDVLRHSKNDPSTVSQLADILCRMYGAENIQASETSHFAEGKNFVNSVARIDPKFVNNPELSDVTFRVEGRIFYAHRIVLVNTSQKFRDVLMTQQSSGNTGPLEIKGVTYKVFEIMMEYLYRGDVTMEKWQPLATSLQLLAAANQFGLDDLSWSIGVKVADSVNLDNCVEIYCFAKAQNCTALASFCDGFFLKNLPKLLGNAASSSENFKRLLFISQGNRNKSQIDLTNSLIETLAQRLEWRFYKKANKCQPDCEVFQHRI